MARQVIRSIRKGNTQWNEDDRLQIGALLLKAGYAVRICRKVSPDQNDKRNAKTEYTVEFWEEGND